MNNYDNDYRVHFANFSLQCLGSSEGDTQSEGVNRAEGLSGEGAGEVGGSGSGGEGSDLLRTVAV